MSTDMTIAQKKAWADRYIQQLLRLCDGDWSETEKVLEVQLTQRHADIVAAQCIRYSFYAESPLDNLAADILQQLANSNAALMLTSRRMYHNVPDKAELHCLGRKQTPSWYPETAEPALCIVAVHCGVFTAARLRQVTCRLDRFHLQKDWSNLPHMPAEGRYRVRSSSGDCVFFGTNWSVHHCMNQGNFLYYSN